MGPHDSCLCKDLFAVSFTRYLIQSSWLKTCLCLFCFCFCSLAYPMIGPVIRAQGQDKNTELAQVVEKCKNEQLVYDPCKKYSVFLAVQLHNDNQTIRIQNNPSHSTYVPANFTLLATALYQHGRSLCPPEREGCHLLYSLEAKWHINLVHQNCQIMIHKVARACNLFLSNSQCQSLVQEPKLFSAIPNQGSQPELPAEEQISTEIRVPPTQQKRLVSQA